MLSFPYMYKIEGGGGGGGDSTTTFSYGTQGQITSPEELVFPKSIKGLGLVTFQSNIVKKISFEAGSECTSINGSVFNGWQKLEVVDLSNANQLTTIGATAFCNCPMLKEIQIPASVTSVGANCFANNASLVSAEFLGEMPNFNSMSCFNGCTSLKNAKLPSKAKQLGGNFFQNCTALKSVELPDTLTLLNDMCFCNCTSLDTIELPASVAKIGNQPFYGCTALRKIKFNSVPTDTTYLDNRNWVYKCVALEEVILADDWTCNLSISSGASDNTNVLTSECLVDMFNKLHDYSGGSTHKLTLGSKNLERVTDEQKKIATDKNWTLS